MARTVYVPLDGSEWAERALGPGLAIATRARAQLVLLAARWPHVRTDTTRAYLDVRAAFLDGPAEVRMVPDRDAADAIVTAADDPEALVCMATHGRGVVRGAALGSVAEAVMRSSRGPLLLVGPSCDAEWDLPDPVLLLAGIDGSELSQEAARAAGVLARSLHGRVRAVEVSRPSDLVVGGGKFPGADVDLLEGIVAELAAGGVAAEYELLDGHDAADTLTREAVVRRAAAIAVASHGRSGLGRLMLGSVAMRVVRHARCPVLVKGPAARSAQFTQHGP